MATSRLCKQYQGVDRVIVERDTLIAIPLFIFMGLMLQRSRIAEDLLVTMAQLFGPVRGTKNLGFSVKGGVGVELPPFWLRVFGKIFSA